MDPSNSFSYLERNFKLCRIMICFVQSGDVISLSVKRVARLQEGVKMHPVKVAYGLKPRHLHINDDTSLGHALFEL